MKAIVNDKKHITLVSHTNGVTIIEASGCIIDLDYQCLASICEISDIDNSYTIAESNRISELEKTIAELEINVSDKAFKISQLEDKLNVASSNSDKDELTERIEFLEKQLTNADNRVTELRNQIIGLTNELDIRRQRISQLNDELNCRDKIIEEKTKRLIELENVEYELNKFRETNTNLQESLESKNSDLIEVTALFKYYRRAFRTFKDYFKPYEKYNLDNSGCNILNSIDKSFIISFREKHIAREAIDELRNCISPMDIFRKYLNDIIEYNIDSMTVYFVEATSPTVIRKFGDNGFIINCRNNREAEIINTLINCNIPVNDVISTYNSYIVSTSIY
jgi:predicted  nucleic acid-binding Zn-ribbon protein